MTSFEGFSRACVLCVWNCDFLSFQAAVDLCSRSIPFLVISLSTLQRWNRDFFFVHFDIRGCGSSTPFFSSKFQEIILILRFLGPLIYRNIFLKIHLNDSVQKVVVWSVSIALSQEFSLRKKNICCSSDVIDVILIVLTALLVAWNVLIWQRFVVNLNMIVHPFTHRLSLFKICVDEFYVKIGTKTIWCHFLSLFSIRFTYQTTCRQL